MSIIHYTSRSKWTWEKTPIVKLDMELLKNTTFITILWVVTGVVLLLLGVYRENLHRKEDSKHQKEAFQLQMEIKEMQKLSLDKETRIENKMCPFGKPA